MPLIANAPESIIPRSDSRNPATTCRGITSNGRPCRRALASAPAKGAAGAMKSKKPQREDLAEFFCWQHKDQADQLASTMEASGRTGNLQMKPRASIDTLMDRLGVLDINEQEHNEKKRRQQSRPTKPAQKLRPTRKTFCCFEYVDSEEERLPPAKPVRPSSSHQQGRVRPQPAHRISSASTPQRPGVSPSHRPASLSPHHTPPSRPSLGSNRPSSSSQTQSLLQWIPPTLSPQTTSLLLTELAKPISEADEHGYIYMFWVTPAASSRSAPPPPEVASSLLPPTPTRPNQSRSVSDAIRAARDLNALTSNPSNHGPGTVRLKIGRTSNVQRRLNEWTRQCSYNLTLIRYYPYTPYSPSPGGRHHSSGGSSSGRNSLVGRKVPHVHRVERLIHLELRDVRVRDLGPCEECGKEHREWFEIGAEKEELRRVDECVRRWVSWGESQGGT